VKRPRALRPGDLVGIVAPAGPVDEKELRRGAAELESLGFAVSIPEGLFERRGFTAGTLERRLEMLQCLYADEAVAAIWCARGGAGAGRLLGRLDEDLLRAHAKLVVGYSDITYLHLYLSRLGLVTLHGPMVARELAAASYDRASLWHAVTGEGSPYVAGEDDLVPLREGHGEGVLRGGCLSILAAAAGTPWALAPKGEDTILFLEDVDERPYRIDRMLLQLRESGAFAGVRGVVFGDMKGCAPRLDEPYRLEDVLLEALEDLEVPLALGLSSGHSSSPAVTLPLGVRARLRCAEGASFEVLEAAVS
jgi:muramoyltetrapeptide carboxypeptidase